MILSEKITELRKRQGLSQEEFGAEIGVSRQAVSKWEMAQTTPDLSKIMAMSEFFGVSTDFLLKDEYDLSFLDNIGTDDSTAIKADSSKEVGDSSNDTMVELSEVQAYIDAKKKAAKNFVISVILFCLSPFPGIIMSLINEGLAIVGAIVQIIILIIVAILIIMSLWKQAPYKDILKEGTELGFGVRGVIEEYKKSFEHTFLLGIIIGVVSLLAAVIPMMIISVFNRENNVTIIIAALVMMIIFAFGISCIVYVVTINQGYKRILKMK
ncbi:MAG: helix-turn-helix domain-containing protein [Eubacterium sp.]|nr:helix-turn-helix domain-containing protein [Eubacterium sp.]